MKNYRCVTAIAASLICTVVSQMTFPHSAMAQLYINEIFFDPGGGGDDTVDEYIELRGAPSMSLADHYLIIVESEDDATQTGPAGEIENIFDFNIASSGAVASTGSNGFLTIRQKGSRYNVAPGTTDLVNAGPDIPPPFPFLPPTNPGYGSGPNSTIGASDLPSTGVPDPEGKLENSGWTAMLIRNESGAAPTLGLDLDVGNDGLDMPNGQPGWTILDSIGIFSEFFEADFGRLYASVNFGAEDPLDPPVVPKVEAGAEYIRIEHEIEYIGRWGNSTGQTSDDWHASNLTDNTGSGSFGVTGTPDGAPDWRQSCIDGPGCHGANDFDPATPAPSTPAESSQGVIYGTKLADTLGAPNFLTGDYNKDGLLNAADFTAWRDTLGTAGTESAHPPADGNHDFAVDSADYDIWVAAFGQTPLAGAASSVPEPASGLMLFITGICMAGFVRRRCD